MLKLTKETLINLEKLQGYLKMTYEFTGRKYMTYKELREVIRFHIKESKEMEERL